MIDNIATLEGYTDEYIATARVSELHILAKPGTDLDGTAKVWDCDTQEFIHINGWLFSFDRLDWS